MDKSQCSVCKKLCSNTIKCNKKICGRIVCEKCVKVYTVEQKPYVFRSKLCPECYDSR